MLNFILENPNLVPSILAILGFIYGVVKWFDERKSKLKESRENLKNERLNKYNRSLKVISGVSDSGNPVGLIEQVSSCYLLLEFPEYDTTTIRIFESKKLIDAAPESWQTIVLPELQKVLEEIKKRNTHQSKV